MASVIKLDSEIRDTIIELGGEDVVKCYQCGRCMPACPWNCLDNIDYLVYRYPQAIKLGDIICDERKEELQKEITDIFRCVGCESCLNECPRGVNISDVLRAVRRILVEYGSYPSELKDIVSRLSSSGNPLGEPAEKRSAWGSDLNIPQFNSGFEYLYNPCCIPAYDSRAKNIARNTAMILKKAAVSFGILNSEESCCGEAIRRVGAEDLFQTLMKNNIDAYSKIGVKKVLTTSPHCYLAFSKAYRDSGAKFETFHITQLFSKLLREKKIVPTKEFNRKVVYHDPCNLGRQMGVYEEPREVLKSIKGLELIEVPVFNRQYSICCSGGSAGVWYDWPTDERLANFRIGQLVKTGAQVIAVACPYCLQMFEETIKSLNLDLQVMDVSEILFEAL